jgi:hypothetical protein
MLISELLQKAKKLYLENQGKAGMCWCIKVIANEGKSREEQSNKGQVPYTSIKAQIPEFNPFYLKSYKAEFFAINQHLSVGLEFWWEIDDVESRIKAFDTLIELYEDIDREFVW